MSEASGLLVVADLIQEAEALILKCTTQLQHVIGIHKLRKRIAAELAFLMKVGNLPLSLTVLGLYKFCKIM